MSMADCPTCSGPLDADGGSTTECAAGRFGTDDDGCCEDCGGCYCDGAC